MILTCCFIIGSQVLQSAVYNNTLSPPSTVERTVNISINLSGSQPCLIDVDVRTASGFRTVLPNRYLVNIMF